MAGSITDNGTTINSLNSSSLDGVKYTDRKTKIIKPGSELDKNSFLKILSAELKNQDPSNAKDSTAYVAQLAQFASMEQMTNLNNTVTSLAGSSLIGKGVTLNVSDSNGVPYTGIVRAVENKGGRVSLGVEVNNNGTNKIMEFSMDNVTTMLHVPDTNMDNVNYNTTLLYASSMIGKHVELEDQDENKKNYAGMVTGVYRENGVIKVNVKLENGEIKSFPYNKVIKIDQQG